MQHRSLTFYLKFWYPNIEKDDTEDLLLTLKPEAHILRCNLAASGKLVDGPLLVVIDQGKEHLLDLEVAAAMLETLEKLKKIDMTAEPKHQDNWG